MQKIRGVRNGYQSMFSQQSEMTSKAEASLVEGGPPPPIIISEETPALGGKTIDERAEKKFKFSIEPAVLVLLFGLNLSATIFKNQIIYQACTSVFLYNASQCGLLGTAYATPESKEIETEVQPYAAKFFMAKTIIESVVPIFGGLFFGAWSDKNGRKPLLIAAFTGYSLIYIITSVICWLSTQYLINPWYYILAVLPESLIGGNCIYRIAIFCYLADVTTVEQRPFRMAFLEACVYTGLMAGSFTSSYIYEATSTLIVFIISASLIVVATLYIIFCVPESLKRQSEEEPTETNPMCNAIGEMLKTCFKARENNVRLIVWLVIIILFTSVFVINGTNTVFYLFVREKFQWTVREFTIYETFGTLVPIFGNVIGMLIMRKIFNVSVTTLALLAMGSSALNALIKGLAMVPWHLYLAAVLGAFKAVGNPMCRTILSNIVPATDLGKIFSFINLLEAVSIFASATLYTYVYSKTLTNHPGAFNLISAGLYGICFVSLAVIFEIKHSKREVYGTTL